jgi:hypothetical protein
MTPYKVGQVRIGKTNGIFVSAPPERTPRRPQHHPPAATLCLGCARAPRAGRQPRGRAPERDACALPINRQPGSSQRISMFYETGYAPVASAISPQIDIS